MSVNSTLKLYKLYTHMKHFCSEDLILNPKEHPNAKLGDVVEIYQHPEEENGCRLLLQITCFKEDLKGRDIISVEANVAAAFNLRTYDTMIMNIVDPASVALDSVEITFKDQYMGRSEMWRLKSFLTNTCVYTNKKIEHCSGLVRCQVYEMWAQGERVSCGVINEETKVVFRSSTSMVYLFIQMSSEMWDFDIHGDLYFEKAVNGFLTDLFLKWKKLGSNHEVTIVLFSRTFYAAKSLDEFPAYMRECLQMDYKGRYYEDFYRVAIQNERNDDWSSILVQLRRLFTSYQNTVLRYHDRSGSTVPATNSTAAQGNFLEVLNISLNVFEKHYLDRSFDRTGQLSVVITPGVGVFEVDRELTNITKQRIIDNGVGSDLVCVGEQPLHAVPLLKFHNKDSLLNTGDDYSMPHWINLSFYSTNKKVAYSTFIPRIKLPPLNPNQSCDENKENKKFKLSDDAQQQEYIHNSLFDYDAYDAQIFTIPSSHGCSLQRQSRTKKTSVPCLDGYGTCTSREWENMIRPQPVMRRKMSDPDIHHGNFHVLSNLSHNGSPNISESMSTLEKQGLKNVLNQSGSVVRPGRALINPFAPSHVTIKLTSNRRRWTHIFPKGPTGVLIQQHHYQAVPTSNGISNKKFADLDSSDFDHTSTCTIGGNIDLASSVLTDAIDSCHSQFETMNSNAKYSIKLNTVLTGVYSLSCRYDTVEVELFFTKEKSSKTQMDYVYFNRVQDKNGKWTTFLNELFHQQCRSQIQSNLRVYGCNIRTDNYESHQDSIIKHCLQKCYKTFVSGIRVQDKSHDTPSSTSDQNDKNLSMADSPNVICETMMSAFTDHLQSIKFDYVKIHSIICQKDDIKVELALTENSSSDDIFARTYVNSVREPDCKWAICLKHLWAKEFPNDSNLNCHPVYIMAITYNERTVKEEVIQNCIERCLINIKNDLPS